MHDVWRRIVSVEVVILVTVCCSAIHAAASVKGRNRKPIRLAGSYNNKFLKVTEYDESSAKLFTEEYYGESTNNTTEANNRSHPQSCHCTGNEECTSEELGSTYIWKEVIYTTNINDIPSAIEYVDTHLCQGQDGNDYRRVALETRQELDFLVKCLLCNKKTYFGSANMKLNIMTAGMVNVTNWGIIPQFVLHDMKGIWSTWDKEVDGTVPENVVLLDSHDGNPTGSFQPVPEELYSIFLVGNGQQLCGEDDDTYYNWGLMSQKSDGPLDKLVRYVVCERKKMPFSTYTPTDVADITSADITSGISSINTFLTSTETIPTTSITSTETLSTISDTSTETIPTTSITSTETLSTISDTSTETTPTTSITSTLAIPTTTTETSIHTTVMETTHNTTPSTTTTSTTITTTTTSTSSSTPTPTTPINMAECCMDENVILLCPGEIRPIGCPPNYSGRREVECIKGRIEVVEDHCIADWINHVDSLINSGNESVVDIAEILKNETDNQSQITQADLTCLVSVISNMTNLLVLQIENINSNNSQELAQNYTSELVKIEGNLFTYEGAWDGLEKEKSGKLGSSLLHDLERTGFILAMQVEEDMLNFTDPTLNMTVLSRPRNELAGHELYFPGKYSDTFIRLPEDFEDLLPEGETQGRVVGFFLDQRAASRALPAALNSLSSEDKSQEINSFVVSMTLGNLDRSVNFTSESHQVLLRLQHTYKESGPYFRDLYRLPRDGEVPSRIPGSAVCVYWDPARSAWVPNGCELVNSTRDVTYCSCSHLSMISVITDVHNYVGRDAALDILGTLLSTLSCVALLLAVYILQFCKGVQTSPRISITKQLCISLFFSHLFLILFLDRDFLKLSEVGCEVVAMVLHYLLTASICWMLAEGLQLFHTVHFTLDPTSFMVAYWLIGYGMPVVVVLVTSLVAFGSDQWKRQEAYAPPGSEYCWLTTEEGYIWAFTGPLVMVIVVNATFMVLAIRSAAILTANRRKSLQHRVLLCIKGSFSLNCVLGVTWVFGLLYINTSHVFAYMFTIFNASQGVMIFVFTCMLNENVRTAFVTSLPKALKQCLMKGSSNGGPTPGRGTSGACTVFNRSSNHPIHHQHDHQLAAPSPQSDHWAVLYNNLRLTSPGHHPASRARSHSDVTDLERRKQQFSYAEDPNCPTISRHWRDKGWQEEEWHRPSLPAHVISDAFKSVASPACRSSSHCPDLPQGASRAGSVPVRMSPPDKRPCCRESSQWSADTQISFLSGEGRTSLHTTKSTFHILTDGETRCKNSLDSSYTEGCILSSSTSCPSSVNHLSAFPGSLEETLRTYPRHTPFEEVQRYIHTIPECEEKSPSSENTFFS